jgi:hypothetical protein
MDPVETIKTIIIRHAKLKDLTAVEREERLKNWDEYQRREQEDEKELVASFRVLTVEQAHDLVLYALDRFDTGLNKGLTPQLLLGKIANFVDGGLQNDYHAEGVS